MDPYAIPENGPNNILPSRLDLESLAQSLATDTQRATTALQDLHLALISTFGQNKRPNPLLDVYGDKRDVLRSEWENTMMFLQHCHSHTGDFVALCQFTINSPPHACLSLAEDILNGAKKILKEAGDLVIEHEKGYRDWGKCRSKFAAALRRTWSPTSHTGLARDTNASVNESFPSPLLPDGARSIVDSYSSLNSIGTSLRDIVNFWKEHVDYLQAVKSQEAVIDVDVLVQRWRRYQSVLLAAITSISGSADALMVNPVPSPNQVTVERVIPIQRDTPHLSPPVSASAVAPKGRGTFWDRTWSIFCHLCQKLKVRGCNR